MLNNENYGKLALVKHILLVQFDLARSQWLCRSGWHLIYKEKCETRFHFDRRLNFRVPWRRYEPPSFMVQSKNSTVLIGY